MAQISRMMSANFLPVLATRDGLVVTPSSNPLEASDLISAVSAVSTKNFISVLREVPTDLFDPDSTPRLPRQHSRDGHARGGQKGGDQKGGGQKGRGQTPGVQTRAAVLLPYPFTGPFDYRVPEGLTPEPGDLVLVPLNKREEVGIVWDLPLGDPPDAGEPVPEHRLRSIIAIIDPPPMRSDIRRLID